MMLAIFWIAVVCLAIAFVRTVRRDIAKTKRYRRWGSHEYYRDEEKHHRD